MYNTIPHQKRHPLLWMEASVQKNGRRKTGEKEIKCEQHTQENRNKTCRAKTVRDVTPDNGEKPRHKCVKRKQTGPTHRGNRHTFRRGPPGSNHVALVRRQGKPMALRRPRQLNRVTRHLEAQELSGKPSRSKPSRSRWGYQSSQRQKDTQKETRTDANISAIAKNQKSTRRKGKTARKNTSTETEAINQ